MTDVDADALTNLVRPPDFLPYLSYGSPYDFSIQGKISGYYLQKIGVIQRFQALEPADRAAVLSGIPRVGMSAEALLFLWGDPYYTAGDARRYAHWYYLGSSFSMAASGNQSRDFGNQVDVYLVKGHIAGWVDYTPATAQD